MQALPQRINLRRYFQRISQALSNRLLSARDKLQLISSNLWGFLHAFTRDDPAKSFRNLESQIARIAALAGGTVGAVALHLETGQKVSFNETIRFPMASTVKVPIAVRVLERVDRGELGLDDLIPITPYDIRPGSGILSSRFRIPGIQVSVRNLIELMLEISDNTASDLLLALAGGVQVVNKCLSVRGITGMSIDRSTLQLIADLEGVRDIPMGLDLKPAQWSGIKKAIPAEQWRNASGTFLLDARDTSTADAMVCLLAAIARGQMLSSQQTSLLLDIMAQCKTGANRLKGRLPSNTLVSHKTGFLPGSPDEGTYRPRALNDVGIIKLPNGLGHIVIAVFIMKSHRLHQALDWVIARIARVAYDYFLKYAKDIHCPN
ncbi:MAG: class A beta-lactamase [Planctomycetes bacterium]|nr:class A beta-lactamase [Planctomycetota bacterium]